MSGAASDPSERLPWLTDPAPPKQRSASASVHGWAGWTVAGALLIGGTSYWLGLQSGQQQPAHRVARPVRAGPEATLKLPQAAPAVEPQVEIAPAPEVKPAPVPAVRMPAEALTKPARLQPKREAPASTAKPEQAAPTVTPTAPVAPPQIAVSQPRPLTLWPSNQVKGAKGRLVQIGAFGSRSQAKLGWRHMERAYPAVGRLPAIVVPSRNSKGRKFYRFQIGTTSQAHSEVLCQRMKMIGLSCAVIGLPWKEKVER